MPFIIGVNPVKKKRTKKKPTKKRKVKTMAAKKKTPAKKNTKIVYRTKEKIKYRTRNPKKNVPYRVRRKPDDNLDVKKIIRASVSVAIGMVIAKAAVNKLSDGGSETVRWTWPNIFTSAAAGIIAAFALGALFKLKKPTVGYLAIGGVALAGYKAFTTKLAPRWAFSESWFGAEDDIHPDFLGNEDIVEYETAGNDYYGELETNSGGQVVPYDPSMGSTNSGGQVVPYDPNMGATASPGSLADMRNIGQRVASGYPGSY